MQHWMICVTLQMTIILKATWMTSRWEHCFKDRSQGDRNGEKERLTIMLRQLHGISETPSKIQALLMELDYRRVPNDRILPDSAVHKIL